MNQAEKEERRRRALLLILLLITCSAIAVSVWAVFFREPTVILTPDYAPPEEEPGAQPIPGDPGGKPQLGGGGSISLHYLDTVLIDLSEQTAHLEYANPGKSTQNIVLQIVIQDEILVQSGLIKPGHRVKQLDLLQGAEKKLIPGVYRGKFVILSYHPDSGEKAMVNTEAAITVTVEA